MKLQENPHVAVPWVLQGSPPKGGNYDGVKRLGCRRRPRVGTELPALLLPN